MDKLQNNPAFLIIFPIAIGQTHLGQLHLLSEHLYGEFIPLFSLFQWDEQDIWKITKAYRKSDKIKKNSWICSHVPFLIL